MLDRFGCGRIGEVGEDELKSGRARGGSRRGKEGRRPVKGKGGSGPRGPVDGGREAKEARDEEGERVRREGEGRGGSPVVGAGRIGVKSETADEEVE